MLTHTEEATHAASFNSESVIARFTADKTKRTEKNKSRREDVVGKEIGGE